MDAVYVSSRNADKIPARNILMLLCQSQCPDEAQYPLTRHTDSTTTSLRTNLDSLLVSSSRKIRCLQLSDFIMAS